MIEPKPLLGGVELGGTKCVCVIGTGPEDVRLKITLPTGAEPETTLKRIEEVLQHGATMHGRFRAIGVASFGPIDLARHSPTYGTIRATAKPGWRNTPIANRLAAAFGVPIGFDTDVNGAALAEGRWGAARGLADFAYVTVGTGVGVGLIVNGRAVHGALHPELGHIRIDRRPGDEFAGVCPFHGDCVEGLAAGPAIAARAGAPCERIDAADPIWAVVAHALGQLLHTLVLATAPCRIVLGGGVIASRPELLPRVRAELVRSLAEYLTLPPIEEFIVAPALQELSGPLGALALAADSE